MKSIKKLIDRIDEELEDAEHYAEKYVECKAKNETHKASRYAEMANDELKHAMYIHEWAVKEVDTISKVYIPPADMQEAYDKAHKKYVERVSSIKKMLDI